MGFALAALTGCEPAVGPPPVLRPRSPIRLNANHPLATVRRVVPVYPADAKERGVEGVIAVVLVVAGDGSVERASAAAGDPSLVSAALSAVRLWRFTPVLLNGEPVEVVTQVDVWFVLAK